MMGQLPVMLREQFPLPVQVSDLPLGCTWPKEDFDDLVPPNGFLHDFILATRGFETPTLFSFWTAVHTVSAVLKRAAWIEWFPTCLWLNFFIVLVAPPRRCAKSTAANFAERILRSFHRYIPDKIERKYKEVNLLRSKCTPEALMVAMKPKTDTVDTKGIIHNVRLHSQATLSLSELATFLGRQKYNVGLVQKLTDLYDCKDEDDEATISRGMIHFENIYFTLLAATTAKDLEDAIPEEAFGGGFMSRTIFIFQETSPRCYDVPRAIPGAPTPEELAVKLAWVAENAQGEYTLDAEAREAHHAWYPTFLSGLDGLPDQRFQLLRYRYDIHLLKLSAILRAQRYEPGTLISLEDYQLAHRIMKYTYETSDAIAEQVGLSALGRWTLRARKKLERSKVLTRAALLTYMSSAGCTTWDLDRIVSQFQQEGLMEIQFDGKVQETTSHSGKEVYIWMQE